MNPYDSPRVEQAPDARLVKYTAYDLMQVFCWGCAAGLICALGVMVVFQVIAAVATGP